MQKTIRFLIFTGIMLIMPSISYAEWAIVYDVGWSDSAQQVRQTHDGGFIGVTKNNRVMKLDQSGTIEWIKQYDFEIFDSTNSIELTKDSDGNHDGYIVAGQKTAAMDWPYPQDLWVFKLNPDGSVAWQKTYGNATGFNVAYSIQQTQDGGYILAGQSIHLTGASYDMWVLKLGPDGAIVWEKTYNYYTDAAFSIQQSHDQDGNPDGYIMAGSDGEFGAWALKLNPDGNILWRKVCQGTFYSIKQTEDHGYIAVGNSLYPDPNIMLVKFDYNGAIEWQKTYGGDNEDLAFSVDQTIDQEGNPDGYIVVGRTNSFGLGQQDIWILKLNISGSIVWQRTYGGSLNDDARSIQQTTDGGFIVGGFTWSFGSSAPNSWILRLNQEGEIPVCSTMGTSEAIVTTLIPYLYDFSMSVTDSSATISNTYVTGEDISVETSVICAWSQDQDTDGDGVPDDQDNCPNVMNPDQSDSDGDGVGEVCDNCPDNLNPDQADSDSDGIGDACETAEDVTPPSINLSVSPNILWPPNHKMVLIEVNLVVTDDIDPCPAVMLVAITSSEPDFTNAFDSNYEQSLGDGHTTDDIVVDENGDIYLRAERAGTGDGRTYTIFYNAMDAAGNTAAASATVSVPHHM